MSRPREPIKRKKHLRKNSMVKPQGKNNKKKKEKKKNDDPCHDSPDAA